MNVHHHPSVQRAAGPSRVEHERDRLIRRKDPHESTLERSDSVKLSSEAKIFAAIQKRLAETPDIRHDKVEALKERIANGTYRVSAEEIAAAMLREGRRS